MTYAFGILLPPVGLLLAGKPVQAFLNAVLFLTGLVLSVVFGLGLLIWAAAIVWACAAIHDKRVRQRDRRLAKALHPHA